jgi:hypothetical protein
MATLRTSSLYTLDVKKHVTDMEQPLQADSQTGMLATGIPCRVQIDVRTRIQVSRSRTTLGRCQATSCCTVLNVPTLHPSSRHPGVSHIQ